MVYGAQGGLSRRDPWTGPTHTTATLSFQLNKCVFGLEEIQVERKSQKVFATMQPHRQGEAMQNPQDKLCIKAKVQTVTLPGHGAILHAVPFLLLLSLIMQIPHSNPAGNAQLENE